MSQDVDRLNEISSELVDIDAELLLLRGVLANVPVAIIGANQDGRISFFNLAAQKMFRLSERDAIGSSLAVLMPERYRAAHLEAIARYGHAGYVGPEAIRLQGHGMRADGTEFPIEIDLTSKIAGGHTSFTATIREIPSGAGE